MNVLLTRETLSAQYFVDHYLRAKFNIRPSSIHVDEFKVTMDSIIQTKQNLFLDLQVLEKWQKVV